MQLESPSDARLIAEVDRTYAAIRASLRPLEFRTKDIAGGHFRGAWSSGLTTVLAANDRIFSMQWTAADRLFVLLRLNAQASIQTAYGAAQENLIDLVKLTGFTAADGGGTAIALGAGYRLSPLSGNSQIASLRIASATAVTAGTSAIDSVVGRLALNLGNVAGNAAEGDLYRYVKGQGMPLTLGQLEGFNARIALTQGAAGVVRFVFTMEWAEIPLAVV